MGWQDEWANEYKRTTGKTGVIVCTGTSWYQIVANLPLFGNYRKKQIIEMTKILKMRPDYAIPERGEHNGDG